MLQTKREIVSALRRIVKDLQKAKGDPDEGQSEWLGDPGGYYSTDGYNSGIQTAIDKINELIDLCKNPKAKEQKNAEHH